MSGITHSGAGRTGRGLLVRLALLIAVVGGLLVGGQAPASSQSTSLGRWIQLPSMTQARQHPASVLMANGRVLSSGGRTETAALLSAEVFDPLTLRWTPTGLMGTSRWRHTATALPDGRVLVAGGFTNPYQVSATGAGLNAQPVTNTAEIYDPATNSWTPTGPMNVRRALHAASILDNGKVLVAGGRTCPSPPPTACDFSNRTNSAELWDPETGTWTLIAPMNVDRHTTSAAKLLDGRVLVPAGFTAAGNGINGDIYNPATGTWSLTGPLTDSRARQGAALLPDGRVLVMAGFPNRQTSEAYNPQSNQWQLTGLVNFTGRFNFYFATLPDGRVLLTGGQVPSFGLARSSELWSPGQGWARGPDMVNAHGTSSSLGNSEQAIVLSGDPYRYVYDSEKCANRCGMVLVIGNHPTGAVDAYFPNCTPALNTVRYACV